MINTTIPTILGGGKSLFGKLSESTKCKLINTIAVSKIALQSHYKFDNR